MRLEFAPSLTETQRSLVARLRPQLFWRFFAVIQFEFIKIHVRIGLSSRLGICSRPQKCTTASSYKCQNILKSVKKVP